MSWRSKIEAQIAKCREKYHGGYADTMQDLLDVAVAAEYVQGCINRGCHSMETVPDLRYALDKLRELDT